MEKIDADGAKDDQLLLGLDSFSEDHDAEGSGDSDEPRDDGLTCGAKVDVSNESHVELEDVRLKVRQQIETSISGAEVI